MPNWKKLVTSDSDASLSTLLLSDVVNAGTDTDKFLVLDASGNVDFRTGAEVRSDIGAGTLSSVAAATISDSTAYSRGIITGSSASGTRTHLGLGSLATLSSINNSNWSGTDLAIANGGTGASDASSARTNLGLGTAATQASTAFVSATASDTMNGSLTIGDGTADTRLIIKRLDSAVSDDIQFFNGTTRVGEIGTEDTTWLRINQETNKNIYTPRYIRADNGFFVDGTSKGINGSGNFIGGTIAGASDANVSNWDTAYSDRYKWDGGSTGLVAATGRTSLGLGSLATLSNINNSNWSGTDLAVANGGTGASDAATARTNLGLGTAATQASSAFVAVAGDSMTGTLNMGNNNISAVNQLAFNDPGPDEGLQWSGGNWKLYESPDDLTTNTKGNLQFVSGSTRVMTIGEGGDTALYIEGSGSTVFDVQGSQGQLFSVTDELTGDLFTVADISGVPIFNIDSDASGSMDGRLDVEGTLSGSKAEFSSGLSVTGAITATGDITAYYSSDARLKDNLRPIINATEKLQNISGYEFEWNTNQTMYSGSDIGVVAQEIEQVLPQIVKDRDNGYKAVEYQKLVALLIQSNKELLTRIEELESKIK